MPTQYKPQKLSRREARYLIYHVFNYPVFIPELGGNIKKFLLDGNVTGLISELRRLSSLGSKPAQALLAYFYMKQSSEPPSGTNMPEAMCVDAANAHDPYAQYVLAWIHRVNGEEIEAMKWMFKSAKALFPPAMVDVGRFMLGGVGVAKPDPSSALKVLWNAHQIGHRMAAVYAAKILCAGHRGLLGRALGVFLLPIAILRVALFCKRYPLSDCIFLNSEMLSKPLFR